MVAVLVERQQDHETLRRYMPKRVIYFPPDALRRTGSKHDKLRTDHQVGHSVVPLAFGNVQALSTQWRQLFARHADRHYGPDFVQDLHELLFFGDRGWGCPRGPPRGQPLARPLIICKRT
jgi:hypothetical protein